MTDTRELLDAATPRPWHAHGGLYGSVVSKDPGAVRLDIERRGRDHVCAYGGVLVGESIDSANRALIVAAVNEYEALLAIADLLRAAALPCALDPANGPVVVCVSRDQAKTLLATLDAVRGGE